MKFYAYLWIDPKNNTPIYAGKGKENRAWSHLNANTSTRIGRTLRKRFQEGFICIPKIFPAKSEQHAKQLEIELISKYGREDCGSGTLFNLTDGGEGCAGLNMSKEFRQKIRSALLGKKHTAERIANHARACSKQFEIKFPDGKLEIISNLNQFCKEHGLSQGNMTIIAQGGRLSKHKGFTCRYV
jgi:hypothetical protein